MERYTLINVEKKYAELYDHELQSRVIAVIMNYTQFVIVLFTIVTRRPLLNIEKNILKYLQLHILVGRESAEFPNYIMAYIC